MIDVEKLSVLEKLVKEQRTLRKRIETAFPKRQIDKNSIACFFGAMTALGIEKDAKLFVMLYLCSPHTLSGCKMKRGLRDFLASLFKYTSPSSVSMKSRGLLFRYKHYKTMQNDVDRALNAIRKSFDSGVLNLCEAPNNQQLANEK